jgi:hypothetical protein
MQVNRSNKTRGQRQVGSDGIAMAHLLSHILDGGNTLLDRFRALVNADRIADCIADRISAAA